MAVESQTRRGTWLTLLLCQCLSWLPWSWGPLKAVWGLADSPQEGQLGSPAQEAPGVLCCPPWPWDHAQASAGLHLRGHSIWREPSPPGWPGESQTDRSFAASHSEASCYLMSGLEGPWRLSGPPPCCTDGETEAQGARSDSKLLGKSGEHSEPVNPDPHL